MRGHSIALVLIAAVCGAAFVWSLGNEFIWDDRLIIVDNPRVHDLSRPLKFFGPEYWRAARADWPAMPKRGYRPVPELLFAVDYSLWGPHPVGYRAVNIVVHAANCVLLYVLGLRILGDARGAAFWALLFAAHPIHVEAVVWVKARSELLALLFVLATILLYGRYLNSPAPSRSPHLHLCTVAAFAVALMCKASAAILPVLLALYIWCFVRRARWRRGLFGLIPFVGIVAAFLAVEATLPHIPDNTRVETGSVALTGVAALGVYLKLLLVPVGLCAHHRVDTVQTLFDPSVLRVLFVSLALLAGVVVAARRPGAALFALAWVIIGLAPLSVLELMGRRVGELRAYAPSVGFCLLLAFLLIRLGGLSSARIPRISVQQAAMALCALLVLAYTGLSAVRTRDWADESTLWHDALRKNPDSWHAHQGLAIFYKGKGLSRKAIPHLKHLIALNPRDVAAQYELALAYEQLGRDEAISAYERLVQLRPRNSATRVSLGALYAKYHRLVEAEDQFKAALHYDPECAEAHHNLGAVYLVQGRHEEAVAELRRALHVAPDDAATRYALGVAYAGLDRNEAAVTEFRNCVTAEPNHATAWMAMGQCYEKLGNAQEAVRCYRKCTELGGPAADAAQMRLEKLARRTQR